MKIKINEFETYEINFPEGEIGAPKFFALKSRFDHIAKLIGRDPLIATAQDLPTTFIKPKKIHIPIEQRPWDQTKEKAIKFIKTHYFGTQKEKEQYEQIGQRNWNEISKRVNSSRLKWNIQPNEVGLKRWPVPGEKKAGMNHLKIIENGTTDETPKEESGDEEAQEAPVN